MGKQVTWLSTAEAAKALGKNPETLRRWKRDGLLAEGAHYRFQPIGNRNHLQFCVAAIRKTLEQ